MDSPPVKTAMQISRIDGRLTIIMALVLFVLLWNFEDLWLSGGSGLGTGDPMHLRVEPQGHLVLEPVPDLEHSPAEGQIPARYLPFFFQPLPINSAGKELLMTIKGIGPQLAETIVNHRHRVGPILSILEFQEISGIGGKRATALATDLVFDTVK
jgi:hypothetical protein